MKIALVMKRSKKIKDEPTATGLAGEKKNECFQFYILFAIAR